MKEFETPLSKLLLPGLRSDLRSRTGLLLSLNAHPIAGVLEYPERLTKPISAPEASLDWPFPTLFWGPSGRYLCCRHYIYKVASDYSLTQLTAWFASAERWSFADFGSYQVLHNGNLAIVVDVASGDFIFDAAFPACKTMLNFKGQLILGNTTAGTNWLQWGRIGYNDFTVEVDNEAGSRSLPIAGPIHRLMYLHSGSDLSGKDRGSFVVYAEGGIIISKPYSEPTLAWGIQASNQAFGVSSFGAVGGTEDEHLFIDNRGQLHKLTVKGDEVLGFKEFLQPLLSDEMVINYDHIEQQYFISTEDKCYIFNASGLGEIDQIISSGWIDGTSFLVTGFTPATLTMELSSVDEDFGIRAKKHLSSLNFNIDCDGKCYAAVSYKDSTGTFRSTGYKVLSPAGVCFPGVTGVDFRILLKALNFTKFQLIEASARWKLVDKHSIRGTYDNAKATA